MQLNYGCEGLRYMMRNLTTRCRTEYAASGCLTDPPIYQPPPTLPPSQCATDSTSVFLWFYQTTSAGSKFALGIIWNVTPIMIRFEKDGCAVSLEIYICERRAPDQSRHTKPDSREIFLCVCKRGEGGKKKGCGKVNGLESPFPS